MINNKKAQVLNIFDLIVGLIIISGGVFVIFNYINLGSFLTSAGLLLEIVKILFKQGWLS